MNINEKIGAIIKARRIELGYSQSVIASLVGVTFQQVQKYEKGANSLNATKLVEFATALKMPVAGLFNESPAATINDASEREALEMIKSFNIITDYNTRKKLADLARAIGEAQGVRG